MSELNEDDLVQVFKALGHPTRLSIMSWLKDPGSFPPQEQPAEEIGVCLKHIQARAGVSQSTASQFMAILQRAGLVTSRRIGPWTHYQRNDERIRQLGSTVANTI
ncbi:helix-turn-helix transcriptional regulator [Arthrobacter sp. ISL-72]|uniref:ArsR/SmtB family transcription factor n=1 Tax=Arthrobacter sp. ISL-72 TaxID=2819114 RepID=UPI001BEAA9BC|nr:metalloregulator ArsR/SmtB family transcription factor [Arthrobacter sp. ISL-72]MBT2598132.1 helix-turn-helix transcriptional regulator [Arthrobacter sp. ISL-72]